MPAGYSGNHPRINRADARMRRLAASQASANHNRNYEVQLYGTGWYVIIAGVNNGNVLQIKNQGGTEIFGISTDASGGAVLSMRDAGGASIVSFTGTTVTIGKNLALGNSVSLIQGNLTQYGYHEFIEIPTAPVTPAAGRFDAYSIENATDLAKSDLVVKDAGGRVHPIASSGGTVDMPELLRMAMQWGFKTETKSATGAITKSCMLYFATGGSITLTIDTVLMVNGAWILILDIDGTSAVSPITVATQGAEFINGVNTKNLQNNYGAMWLMSNGANWFAVSLAGL